MNDSTFIGFLLLGISACFTYGVIGYVWAESYTRWKVQQEAIAAGHAEYYIDEDGEKAFRWKEIK